MRFQRMTRLASLLCAAFALGACQHTSVPEPAVSETINRNEVKMVRLPFRIAAELDGSAEMSSHTLNSISLFLRTVGAGHADVILLDAPDIAAARVDAVATHIRMKGLTYGGAAALGDRPAPGDMTLYVERHIVIPPTCGTWSEEQNRSEANNPNARFGCSTIANLGLMIANPRDLIAGQDGGNSTAAAVSAITGGAGGSEPAGSQLPVLGRIQMTPEPSGNNRN